jgi:RND family efflux transporter MFP subunit
MTVDDKPTSVIVEAAHAQGPSPATVASQSAGPPRQGRRGPRPALILGLLLVTAGSAAGYWYVEHQRKLDGEAHHNVTPDGSEGTLAAGGTMRVEVIHPKKGGLERRLQQVCSVHAFEHAQLFAKVSGFLKVQNVDIGDRVKRDQLLAELDVPELHKAVDQAKAGLDQAKANIEVAQAKIRSAESLKKASAAMIQQAKADVAAKTAFREYRGKQFERIKGLVLRQAVEEKLQDEAQDQYDASIGAERSAQAAVLTAEADLAAKQALVEQAQADLIEAKANVEVAQANLEKAQVMASYTQMTSPYDGVITLRSFHRGDFIRSASEGGNVPVLSVARTDLMRVIIPVPDREVPFTNKGDKATIVVDALPDREFPGVVSRFSESENPQDRNMRTEVDLENKDDALREGMYGQATLLLDPAAPGSVTVPSSSLLKQSSVGDGEVFVVRDGKAHKVAVKIGMDNGNEAEVVKGLSPEDTVVSKYNGALAEGTPVVTESAKLVQASP